MNKRIYGPSTTMMKMVALCCLFFSIGISSIYAQGMPKFKYDLSCPHVKSFAVTDKGYSVTFDNVKWPFDTGLAFYEILTREYDVAKDGEFFVSNTQIYKNKEDKPLGGQVYLDNHMSETGWSAINARSSKDGIKLSAELLNIPGATNYFDFCQIDSPFMFLRGNGGRYRLSFDVKSESTSGVNDTLTIMTYGQELIEPNSVLKDVIVPNDGKIHHFDIDFENGTWNQRIVLGPKSKSSLVFVNSIKVTQNLKKGDHVYRAVYYNQFDRSKILPAEADNLPKTVYTHNNENIDKSFFDFEKTDKNGGYLAYRMLYRFLFKGFSADYVSYSMYSEPFYVPGQNVPDKDSKYYYLGYVGKEIPMTDNVAPASATFGMTYLGAIKIPAAMSQEFRGKSGKVVGVRFCSGAKSQDTQWFETQPWDSKLPFAFVAEKLNIRKPDGSATSSSNQFIQMKSNPIGEGWNDFYFDEPYPITDKDFYVGFCVYDASKQGRAFYLSDQVIDSNLPDSRLTAYTTNVMDYNNATFSSDNYTDQALLIQAIVKVDQDVNEAEILSLRGDKFYYDNQKASYTVDIKNTGNIAIKTLKLKTGVKGHEEEQSVTFENPIQSGDVAAKTITINKLPSVYGKVKFVAQILSVNDTEVTGSNVVAFDSEIVNSKQTFPRKPFIEFFTDEKCSNCPRGEFEFFEDFAKLPNDLKDGSIFVFHHEGLGPDIFTMQYTTSCLPFFGVNTVDGEKRIIGGAPKLMFNRMLNPELTNEQNGIVASLPPTPKMLPAFEYATNKVPAYGAISVVANKEDDGSLNIVAKGKLSTAIDKNRPVYITLLMTQDSLPGVDQKGVYKGAKFFHNHVLRYVDEYGFMGQEVKVDNDNNFEYTYKIKPELVAFDDIASLRNRKIKDNQFIMLNQEGKAIDSLKTISHINVIAFIHYAKALPGKYDLTMENPEAFLNEVINADQTKVNMKPTSAEEIHSSEEDFHFEGSKLVYTVQCKQVRVYSINGISLNPYGDFDSGIYVVTAILSNGQHVVKKLICKPL